MAMRREHVVVVLLILALGEAVSSLSVSTHSLVNREAAEQADVFRSALGDIGFHAGLATTLESDGARRLSIQAWLEEGGEREDDLFRYVQHFHDPLKPWDSAGLGGLFTSSIRWMQQRDQGGFVAENRSWHDARRLYYDALTEAHPRRREALWADLFLTLGQIMHLVVDASVPEHARNDTHLLGAVRLQPAYEQWVEGQHSGSTERESEFGRRYLSAPIGFDRSILDRATPSGEQIAKVPVARLIDADGYEPDGSNPSVTVGADPGAPAAAGLAEIANANFFSENTLRGEYPHPKDHGLIPVNLAAPFGRVRRYYARPAGQGLLPANPLRAECATEAFNARSELVQLPPYPCVDAVVWGQVAAHMLPRAVGYARGVLDYFFRGSLRVRRLYAREGGTVIDIENLADEEMEGVFELFARTDHGTSDERRHRHGTVNHGAPTTIAPGAVVTLPVAFTPGQPTAAQLLVFRGRIGLEQEAVAGQVFTVPHVVVAQTAYAADLRESCQTTIQKSRHVETCQWSPNPHIIEGDVIADLTSPVIASVTAMAPLAGRPQLELDGVVVPGASWTRSGDERNPRRFRITFTGNPHGLSLRVRLVNGTLVSTPLMTLIMAAASAEKTYTTFGTGTFGENPPWWVAARRTATLRVTANPSYRTLSISGHPTPTNQVTDRYGIDALQERIVVSQTTSETSYFQRWVDYASVLTTRPPGGAAGLEAVLRADFDALVVGSPPRTAWEAVLERVYDPSELELLKTFVTADPPPLTFTAAGRRPGGVGAE